MIRFLILCIAILLPITADAYRAYSRDSAAFPDKRASLSDQLLIGCPEALATAGFANGTVMIGSTNDWGGVAANSGLITAPMGTTGNFTCNRWENGVVTGTANLGITVVTVCAVNVAANAIMLTTIATWDGIESTPTDLMPNPQCNNYCVVEHPTGGNNLMCEGYVLAGVTVAVGVTEWVVCSGVGFQFTGASCNYVTSDYTGMATTAELPANLDSVMDSGGGVTSAVDTSETCVDADANGYDDDSNVACSVLAAAQLDALTSLKTTQMEDVGKGASMPGDVNALAAQNGGIFAWPQALLNFLNPPASCDFQFVLNALPMLTGMNATVGWCSIKTVVEPFLAFGMWVITIFVSAGFFQRVS